MIYNPLFNPSIIDPNYISSEKKQIQKKIRVPFKSDEDELLKKLVEEFGDKDWAKIASHMNGRTIRQCRERWQNNLSSSVDKSKWTKEEDRILRMKYNEFGPKWKLLEEFFPGRTSYNIRNRWNGLTRTKKKSLNHQKINNISIPIKHNYEQNIDVQSTSRQTNFDQTFFNIERSVSSQKFVVPLISDSQKNIEEVREEANNTNETNDKSLVYNIKLDEEASEDDMFTDAIGGPFFSCENYFFFDKDNLSCF